MSKAARWSNSSIPSSKRSSARLPKSWVTAWSTTGWSYTACASTARNELTALREALRWVLVALGFLVIVPAHVIAAWFGRREAVPPLFLATMGRIAGLRVRVEGQCRPGALLLANHVSWLDILALA